MAKVTKDMMICDILDVQPHLEEIFISHGMNCVGCPGSNLETLEEAAAGHGVNLEKLLKEVNEE
jgi:hybrid cluster-associated redox disulfide protein